MVKMVFIWFLFYKIYSFYNRFWPNKDPEIYSYIATAFILSLNLYSLHFGYLLASNPRKDINEYFALVPLGFCLLLVYLGVMKNGRYKNLSAKDFKSNIYKGAFGNTLIVCYIIASFALVLILAYLIRQYRI